MTEPDKIIYSDKSILMLAAAIKRDDEAFDWLFNNGFKELAALVDVLVYSKQDAMDWLNTNHFKKLLSFVGALDENDDAIQYLMLNNGKNWAATAEMVNGSDSAPEWLQHYFPVYGALAEALIAASSPHGGGIGGFSGGGGGGGGGFGGFGGGSFGGGGGGGKW